MDQRKFRILQAIIDDYILTAVPVGSRTISKKYDMGLSSATIRNEMSDLEELGYLDQPHISAGRIPSAKAYRLYVDQLLQAGLIPNIGKESVQAHFSGRVRQMEDVIDQAAHALSALTHYTAVVLSPESPQPVIRNLQLVQVARGTALLVVVTDSSIIRDMVIRVPEQLDNDALYSVSRMLTERLSGHNMQEASQMLSDAADRDPVGNGLYRLISESMDLNVRHGHVGVGGSSNMLKYPEYNDVEKARNFLSLMESPEKLASIISQHNDMAFTVRIGPETGVPEMADCSIVTANYSTGSGQQGTIGIIGPTRMHYSKVISILNSMGNELSELFTEGLKP